jgi:hypothetical protein
MTAYSKAFELVEKYTNVRWDIDPDTAKQCALIAIDEILGYMGADRGTEFWLEVRSELKKL